MFLSSILNEILGLPLFFQYYDSNYDSYTILNLKTIKFKIVELPIKRNTFLFIIINYFVKNLKIFFPILSYKK